MKCFVISPIGPEGSEIRRHADSFFNYIVKPALAEYSFTVVRADQICGMSSITDDIYKLLRESDLVIADISDLNANVYYELGFRLAINKNCIIMKDKDSTLSVPFDIGGYRYLPYSLSIDEASESVQKLKEFIDSTNFAAISSIDDLLYKPTNEFEGGIVIKSSNDKDHLNFTVDADGNWRIG